MKTTASPAFPFAVVNGSVASSGPAEALRGQIVHVLFTAPGERIDLPDFGCGLFSLVFEPNDELLRAAVGFTIAQSLTRWLGDLIVVQGVQVSRDGPTVGVEVAYLRRSDLVTDGLRIRFEEGVGVDNGLTAAGRPFDYRARDAAALLAMMRAMIPEILPEWTSYESEADFGTALLELVAHLGDIIGYYTDAAANESFLGTAQTRRSVIEHLRLIGYRLSTAAPAAAALELTVAERPAAPVKINRGDVFATASQRDAPSVRFEYTGLSPLEITFAADARPDGQFGQVPVPVVEGRLVTGDVLGTSDGTSYQRFSLTFAGIILRSFSEEEFALTLGDETVPTWRLRDTLAFSGGSDQAFTIEIDDQERAQIAFGENTGEAGTLLRASYRVGGGEQGNVARDTIQTVVDVPDLARLTGLTVTNPKRATGGAARESIAHAVAHAPGVFRSLGRAVTAADYEAIASGFVGVGKARARARNWNVVSLIIAPEGGGAVSDVLKGDLIRHFEDMRPIGTRLDVLSVDYVPVFITAAVDVEPYRSNQQIVDQVRAAVGNVLAFERVSFGEVIYLSKFYEAIEAIDGVAGVNITEFSRPGQGPRVPADGKLVLLPDEIPRVPEPDDLELHPHDPPGQLDPSGVQVTASGGAA